MNIPAYFAIRHKVSKKFISGSDFRYTPPHSIFADELRPPMLFNSVRIKPEIQRRGINMKNYEVVLITVNPYEIIKIEADEVTE